MTNFERIKNMNIEEMAEQIPIDFLAYFNAVFIKLGGSKQTISEEELMELKQGWIKWLESEGE